MKKMLTDREIQLEELNILLKVKKIIENNNLRYSLTGGTLIGAIRHKGFIPWDDDIDICMPRPDYEKFVNIFMDQNTDSNLELKCPENGTSFQPFAKVVNKKIELIDHSICDQERRYLWVDIFPIDGISDNRKKAEKDFDKVKKIARLLYISHYSVLKDKYSSTKKKIIKLLIKPYALLYDCKSIIKIAKKYDYNSSKYVGNITWGCGYGEINLKEDLDEVIDWEFEGYKFKVFKGYDAFLRNVYGNYMELPPIEKRKNHGVVAWTNDSIQLENEKEI